MNRYFFHRATAFVLISLGPFALQSSSHADQKAKAGIDTEQVPKWSSKDLDFYLHGSMSTEVVPERGAATRWTVLQTGQMNASNQEMRETLAGMGEG